MSVYKNYITTSIKELKDDLGVKNIHQVPRLDKVIVSMGIGSLATRKGVKDFTEFQKNLAKITGQIPQLILSKKAISNFKLREGMPVMLKVTLRREKAYAFLEKLTKIVLPRVRDFVGLSPKSFDKFGNYTLGLQSYHTFPELGLDDVVTPMGLQITVVSTTTNKEYTGAMLKKLGYVFIEKN